MIYRLRRKFIWICTLSFLGVFAALLLGICLATYLQTTRSLDDLADIVSENGGQFPDFQPPSPQEDPRPAERDPEAPFTTRFFTVFFGETGQASANVGLHRQCQPGGSPVPGPAGPGAAQRPGLGGGVPV